MKIPIKLIEEVLKIGPNQIEKVIVILNNILYGERKNLFAKINIYEFGFLCKTWAIHKNYQIISANFDEQFMRRDDELAYCVIKFYTGDDVHREYKDMYFMANTEIEAIIKVCIWILKQND